ncbi:MAG: HAD family phosphatase [Candidatus Shapirobacteria bacterium]
MIKKIIFDFGNVICYFTNDILIRRISCLNGKTEKEVFETIYKKSDITKRLESGTINSEEFYKELSVLCGLNVSYEELKEIFSKDKFTPIEGMNDLIKSLKKRYKIGLLSNTGPWDYDYIFKIAPIVKTFDTITTSFEAGAMKPSPIIFEDALKKSQLKPEECLYTDDIADYVEAAKRMGMNAIQFTTTEKFRNDLVDLGVIIE